MKSIILTFALLLVSCGGGSNNAVSEKSSPSNFSIGKFNNDQIKDFYIPEMTNVLNKLNTLMDKTQDCSEELDLTGLKSDWKDLTLSYQKLWPLNHATIDRDPAISAEKSVRYIESAYPVLNCRVQENTVNQNFSNSSLRYDPAINLLELFLHSDYLETNFCKNAPSSDKINTWLSSNTKSSDFCKHIHSTSKSAYEELKEIFDENVSLYEQGESYLILSSTEENEENEDDNPNQNVQKSYDSLSNFIDQVLKDDKLGSPLGFSQKCPFKDSTCPTAVEHRLSKISFEAISKNLEGIMEVYNRQSLMNTTPLNRGMYQFLRVNNNSDLALKIYNNIIEAHKLSVSLHGQDFENLSESLNNATGSQGCTNATRTSDEFPACALYKSVKALSDSFKVDVRLALALSSTKPIEGDSD